MEQAYVNLRMSHLRLKHNSRNKNFDVLESDEQRTFAVEPFIPIEEKYLPAFATQYYEVCKNAGLIKNGSPILYVRFDENKIMGEDKVEDDVSFTASWPVYAGFLGQKLGSNGEMGVSFRYFSSGLSYEMLRTIKEGAVIDVCNEHIVKYNQCDIAKMIRNVPWKAELFIGATRYFQDSDNQARVIEAVEAKDELNKIIIKGRRTGGLLETVGITYDVGRDMKIKRVKASSGVGLSDRDFGFNKEEGRKTDAPERTSRNWDISSDEGVAEAIRGTRRYDVVRRYLGVNAKMPIKVKEMDLGELIGILPDVISSLRDFVEK